MAHPTSAKTQGDVSGSGDSFEDDRVVTQSLTPSHILQDGRLVILPPPLPLEKKAFVERSIAKHGLLQQDLGRQQNMNDEDENAEDQPAGGGDANNEGDDPLTKVHPLALASARLQNDGINELNRAINLTTLVQSNEYFGLSNIVADAALELAAAAVAAKSSAAETDNKETSAGKAGGGSDQPGSSTGVPSAAAGVTPGGAGSDSNVMQESQRVQATYILKRKYGQFRQSSQRLKRHRLRLEAAIAAEARPLHRLRQLRQHWRLAAPEHGSRARPHPTRPTEVVAADVDVYLVHSATNNNNAGSKGLPTWQQQQQQQQMNAQQTAGRLARSAPRYATIELQANYEVQEDIRNRKKEKSAHSSSYNNQPVIHTANEGKSDGLQGLQGINTMHKQQEEVDCDKESCWTRAVPFVLADPTLGKVENEKNMDDDKHFTMLTLEFSVEKPCSGFALTTCLEPFAAASVSGGAYQEDEKVLVALQHSLFCSKLFEAIRREIAVDTEEVGNVRRKATEDKNIVWIHSANNEQFLPAPSAMIRGLPTHEAIAVIHCHEGEVCVQLNEEYTLRVRLVEAAMGEAKTAEHDHPGENSTQKTKLGNQERASKESGSHSVDRLLVLCRALMWKAQQIYHHHSLNLRDREISGTSAGGQVLQRHRALPSPRILQQCICFGAKFLLESQLRETLKSLQNWVNGVVISHAENSQNNMSLEKDQSSKPLLEVVWQPLSVLDQHAHFCLAFDTWCADCHVDGGRLTITTDGGLRKVDFFSAWQLSIFIRQAIQVHLKQLVL